MLKKSSFLLLLSVFFYSFLYADISYNVQFSGFDDQQTLKLIKSTSRLVRLQDRPIRSTNALRYRADGDITEMIQILHSFGYYDANINIELESREKKIQVYVIIFAGPRYTLQTYNIYKVPCEKREMLEEDISLKDINISLGKPLLAKNIIQAKFKLLTKLAALGYPLATIEKQDVFIDKDKKSADVQLCIKLGPFCYFGPTTIIGIKNINPRFIARKIEWEEGQTYQSNLVEKTQERLVKTDLFSSVLISHLHELDEKNKLPMKINLTESKHKNISIGVSYATIDGLGIDFGWINRNFRQMGELISIQGEISQIGYTGITTYKKPDFIKLDQDFVAQLMAIREEISPYLAFTYSFLGRIDHKLNEYITCSGGVSLEFININESANNGKFTLLGIPIYVQRSTANHLLNPTSGYKITYRPTPFYNIAPSSSIFLKQILTLEGYLPLYKKEKLTLASRLQLGSIVGAKRSSLPLPKLFLGGSDDDLRGYLYRTVSPRDKKGRPLGGKSAIYWTVEPRFRPFNLIGFVPFFDVGRVSSREFPSPIGKWYKSVGIGLRYFSFFGPLRLDVGFPLDRRNKDPKYRIYISIGQTF